MNLFGSYRGTLAAVHDRPMTVPEKLHRVVQKHIFCNSLTNQRLYRIFRLAVASSSWQQGRAEVPLVY
jgi:hypothetical protein